MDDAHKIKNVVAFSIKFEYVVTTSWSWQDYFFPMFELPTLRVLCSEVRPFRDFILFQLLVCAVKHQFSPVGGPAINQRYSHTTGLFKNIIGTRNTKNERSVQRVMSCCPGHVVL